MTKELLAELKAKLINAATEHDQKEKKKRSYNPHALAQYMQRIDQVCDEIEKGADVAAELGRGFTGSLLKKLAKVAKVEAKEGSNLAY